MEHVGWKSRHLTHAKRLSRSCLIDKSDFVIANLTLPVRNTASWNANVWFEVGYAWKADKPGLLFRHPTDNSRLIMPSDVNNHIYFTYCDAIDLALQLFYGFGGPAKRNAKPNLS